jgi:hypothetical protein
MKTRTVSEKLFREILLSLDRADGDSASLILDIYDIKEMRLCAESHDVAVFARHARPCIVVPDKNQAMQQNEMGKN